MGATFLHDEDSVQANITVQNMENAVRNLYKASPTFRTAIDFLVGEDADYKIQFDVSDSTPEGTAMYSKAGWEEKFGVGTWPYGEAAYAVVIDTDNFDGNYHDGPGQNYDVSLERLIAHEIGHLVQTRIGWDVSDETNRDKVVDFENEVMNEAYDEPKELRDNHNDSSTDVNPPTITKIYDTTPEDPIPAVPDRDKDIPTVEDVEALFDSGENRGSPLVLDLDLSGTIDLISLASSTTYWDIDVDGFAEATGWVASQDGLLAIDSNGNGRIDDNSELFGSMTVDGFTELAVLDSNQDGIISDADVQWQNLIVWQDANTNGYSESTELKTLADYDIITIDLNATEVSQTNQGHAVTHTSTFTVDDGVNPATTHAIHDVWFEHDITYTVYVGDYTLDFDALLSSDLRGYGTLPDLHIAMSLDNTGTGNLLSLVQALDGKTFAQLFDETQTLVNDVRGILFRWAGVDGVTTDSRGPFIDGQDLGFLEKFVGKDFIQRGVGSDPEPQAAEDLKEAFRIAFNHMYGQLLAQTAGGELFTGTVTYNPITDTTDGITGLNSTKLSDLETEATGLASTAEKETFWQNVLRMVEYSVGTNNLSTSDQTALSTAITNSDASLSLSTLLTDLEYAAPAGTVYNGTTGDDTITGGTGHDTLNGKAGHDTLTDGVGNDILNGGDGNDALDGGAGGDYLLGGNGNDTYNYNVGGSRDVILEAGVGTGNDADKILFGSGITLSDLTITRVGGSDLYIEIDNGTSTGRIVIENQFNYAAGGGHVELIEFSDASTYRLDDKAYTLTGTAGADILDGVTTGGLDTDTINGLGGDDTITGGTGNDVLDGGDGNDIVFGGAGNDTLTGGAGNDDLRGDGGNDTLYAGAGDDTLTGGIGDEVYHYVSGHDTIFEGGGTDEIRLDAVWNGASPQYLTLGSDLVIWFDIDNTITIGNFYATGNNKVETLKFADATTVDLLTVPTSVMGDDNNNTLWGTANDDVFFGMGGNDTLNGGSGSAGNDTLYGGTGDDILRGGTGDDYLDGGAGDDWLEGHAGNDHYYYNGGHDTLWEGNDWGNADVVELAPGYTLNDLTFRRDVTDANTLLITVNAANTLKLKSQFASGYGIFETLKFSDASTVNLAAQQYETHGTAGNDSIWGITVGASLDDIIYGHDGSDTIQGQTGADTLYGGNGNDTLYGGNDADILYGEAGDDVLDGGYGADTYIYSGGLDQIWDAGTDIDIVKVTGGVTINDITMTDSGASHAYLIVNSGTDELFLGYVRSGSWKVDKAEFDDGFVVDLGSYQGWSWGTSGADTLNGTSGADTIIGKDGNDTINAGAGADAAHGGLGNDILHGQAGDDQLHGGAGDDTLYGEDGLDTLFGGAGADTVVLENATAFNNVDVVKDFSTADNDKLDISDILTPIYDPLTDLLTDYVQITDNGTDSTLSIDRDGTGATYGFDAVASILGVTGLTDEIALETSGHLITA